MFAFRSEPKRLLKAFLVEHKKDDWIWDWKPDQSVAAQAVLDASPEIQRDFLLESYRRADPEKRLPRDWMLEALQGRILSRNLPFRDEDLVFLARELVGGKGYRRYDKNVVGALERQAKKKPLPKGARDLLKEALARPNFDDAETRQVVLRIQNLVGASALDHGLERGEAWTDVALDDLEAMPAASREAWTRLLLHGQSAKGARPSKRWTKQAQEQLDAVGAVTFRTSLERWLPLVAQPRSTPRPLPYVDQEGPDWHLSAASVGSLRGLVWCCAVAPDPALIRLLTPLALTCYKKIPGVGPREVSLGNACVNTLGGIPGLDALGQLAILQVKVRFGTAQRMIGKALDAAAERENLPREQIAEMVVPTYDLEDVGHFEQTIGAHVAEIVVEGSQAVSLRFRREDGKTLKSVPAAVKQDFPDELADLRTKVKDLKQILPAQRDRLDRLYLEPRTWPYATWAERYHEHPVVGVVARRLIWRFTTSAGVVDAIWTSSGWMGSDGEAATFEEDGATVELWHPIDQPADVVMAWRAALRSQEIRQPFKQAHREVYLLTDAERTTGIYSNRFAAHILKQHQFHALCGARGWKNALRLAVDDECPPATRELPEWNLRAEFWVEGVGEEYGVDTNDAGTFHYVSTDQTRFYRIGAAENTAHAWGGSYTSRAMGPGDEGINEPLPLDEIPPLVLSEILRDCDLFVGVASVANDPNWADGGREGRYRTYWENQSFGELGATARTRKSTLEELVPRLKIGPRCRFEDRFLVVKGELREYKIHLGSGNILMAPNDQYLCIVPSQGAARKATGKVYLPFEGDNVLSIILSKALLLADDTKIEDKTIRSQIGA